MMTNVLQTNPTETRDLLSLRLLASLRFVLAALPIAWMWRLPVRRLGPLAQGGRNLAAMIGALAIGAALLFAIFADLSATMRNHKSLRYLINPHNSFYALGVLAHRPSAQAGRTAPADRAGCDARGAPAGAKPPLFLLVIGETARADHFSLNGYERATNPQLARRGELPRRQLLRHQHGGGLGALYGLAPSAARPGAVNAIRRTLDLAWRAGLAVLWLTTTGPAARACARACPTRWRPKARRRRCAATASASTRRCCTA